jgi:uncharacterized protein (TIGR02145 family)
MPMKFYLLGLAITATLFGAAFTDSNADHICGDANGDGALNVSDAVYIVNYIFTGGPAPYPNCCESDCPPTVTDIDGNTYFTIKIGDQCWMAQNLKVTKYRNGDSIPVVTDDTKWYGLSTGAYCNYLNDAGLGNLYGRLYNWYAIYDSRGLTPEGWHVPTDEEWKQLEMYLGMSQAEADAVDWRGTDEGGKLKDYGIALWRSPNTGATNERGFTVLPGGHRTGNGYFTTINYGAFFWSSTMVDINQAWQRFFANNHGDLYRSGYDMRCGKSIRCIKD